MIMYRDPNYHAKIVIISNKDLINSLYSALLPESESQPRKSGKIHLRKEASDKLIIEISSDHISIFRAMLTSYIRIIDMLKNVSEVSIKTRNS